MDTSALSGLSQSCQSALPQLLTSSFATCADVLGLVQIASASGSIVPPLDSYIHDICGSDACSASDLSNANTIVTSNCATDIQSGSLIPTALQLVIQNFNGIRAVACTQRTSNSSYCVPEILYAAQNATGTQFNISTLTSLADAGTSNTLNFLEGVPQDIYCGDCGNAVVTEALNVVQNVSADSVQTIRDAAQKQCGANFATGTLPAGISTVGNTTSGTSINASSKDKDGGALSSFSTKHALVFGTLVASFAGALVSIA